jgi:hypothetical protein
MNRVNFTAKAIQAFAVWLFCKVSAHYGWGLGWHRGSGDRSNWSQYMTLNEKTRLTYEMDGERLMLLGIVVDSEAVT